MMLADITCPNVVTDVSVGDVVETLTSRIVDWVFFMPTLKLLKGSCDTSS